MVLVLQLVSPISAAWEIPMRCRMFLLPRNQVHSLVEPAPLPASIPVPGLCLVSISRPRRSSVSEPWPITAMVPSLQPGIWNWTMRRICLGCLRALHWQSRAPIMPWGWNYLRPDTCWLHPLRYTITPLCRWSWPMMRTMEVVTPQPIVVVLSVVPARALTQ